MGGASYAGIGTDTFRGPGAQLTNPGAATLLCDGGPVNNNGAYLVGYILAASAAATVRIRHQAVGNASTIWSFDVPLPAGNPIPLYIPIKDTALAGERFDCITVTGPGVAQTIQGFVQGTNVG